MIGKTEAHDRFKKKKKLHILDATRHAKEISDIYWISLHQLPDTITKKD